MALRPSDVFFYLDAIKKICPGLNFEKTVSRNLMEFAKHLGLLATVDKNLTVIIKKPAYEGYGISPPVILQGQMSQPLGVAMMMAILANPSLPHPALCCLFTVKKVNRPLQPPSGKILINLNHSKFGEALVAAPGAHRLTVNLPIIWAKPAQKQLESYLVQGLEGNIRLMGQILRTLQRFDVSIFKIECDFLGLTLNKTVLPTVTKALKELERSNTQLDFQKTGLVSRVFSYYTVTRLTEICLNFPSDTMSPPELTETTLSLSALKTTDKSIQMVASLKSTLPQPELLQKIQKLAQNQHATLDVTDQFPAWTYNPNSPLLTLLKECYHRQTRQELKLITSQVYEPCNFFPDLDKISIGPTKDDLTTVEPFYKLLLRVLKEL